MREEIVAILCRFHENCIYRKQSSCFTLGEWGICQPVRDADAIVAGVRAKIEALDNPYSGRRGGKEPESAFEDWRRELLTLFGEGDE